MALRKQATSGMPGTLSLRRISQLYNRKAMIMQRGTTIDLNNFLEIESGNYQIGVHKNTIEAAFKKIANSGIKKEFLYHSFPEHLVATKRFRISQFLTTISQFEEFITETDYKTEAEKDGWGWVWENRWLKKKGVSWKTPFGNNADIIYFDNKDIFPVLMISWNDASAYCKWLSHKGHAARLPFESEWEIFAGIIKLKCMDEIDINSEKEKFCGSSEFIEALTHELTRREDINQPGSIWEWSDDWFDSYPSGIENKEFGRTYKVLRGGSLLSHPVQRTREYRFRRCPTARSPYYGFRITLL